MFTHIRRGLRSRRVLVALVATALMVAFVGCGDDGPSSDTAAADEDGEDLQQIHFILDFTPKGQVAPFYVALDKGFWLDEGLSVSVSPGFGSGDTAVRVGTGEGEFGFAGVPDMMGAIAEGLPLLQIASVAHVDPEGVYARPDAQLSGAEDVLALRGAIDGDEDPARTYLGAYMNQEGHDVMEIDWQFVSGAGAGQVASGEADFVVDFITNLPEWWLLDPPIEPATLWHGQALDLYGNGLITRPEILEDDPELAGKFVRGVMRAYQYVIEGGDQAHQEAIDILFKYNPDLEEQPNAEEFHLNNLKMFLSVMLIDETEEHGIGYLTEEKMERTVQIINEFILDEPLDMAEVFAVDNQPLESGEFLIEDFDGAKESIATIMGRDNPLL